VDRQFIPAPSEVVAGFGAFGTSWLAALGDTLAKAAAAYALSAALGISAGILIGSMPPLHDVVQPFVVALYGLPKILILPWLVLLLGFGAVPAVAYGALHGFFPVLVLVVGGVRDVDRTLLTVARSFGARPWQVYV
jgi:NitT/TauT family transport system permease protein